MAKWKPHKEYPVWNVATNILGQYAMWHFHRKDLVFRSKYGKCPQCGEEPPEEIVAAWNFFRMTKPPLHNKYMEEYGPKQRI